MYKKALEYYDSGHGCSKSILLAARDEYGFVTEEVIESANAINNGFGIGSFCSALVAGIMILGLCYKDDMAYKKRLMLMGDFQEKFCSVNCGCLSRERSECSDIIKFVCNWLDRDLKNRDRL